MTSYVDGDYEIYYGDVFIDEDHCSTVVEFIDPHDYDRTIQYQVLPDNLTVT